MPTTVYRVTTSYVGGHGADGRRGPRLPVERTEVPLGRLRDPALFAPWRVMWRPVFPGCHTHSGGFAIHVGRSCALGADNGNRTHLRGLGSRRSADELYPRMPCRGCTGAPLRERRACTYGPRLEGRRILRAASAPLVSETGVEPGDRPKWKSLLTREIRPRSCCTIFAHAVWSLAAAVW